MSSGIKKLKLNSTPNSSKLAEILLQLKEDHQTAMQPQMILQEHDFEESIPESSSNSPSEVQVVDPIITNDADNAEDQGHTLPASEACNCRKSRCLKLYCQCFAGRAICGQFCRCVQCDNRSVTSAARVAAIKSVLERNPNAFESKYKTAAAESDVAPIAHKNGCRCRKSLCLKKYCECFQGGVHCSNICTCLVCYNRNGPPLVVNRVNSLPTMDLPQGSVLDQYSAFSNAHLRDNELVSQSHVLAVKRALSDSSLPYQPLDESLLIATALPLQSLAQRMSLSSNEDESSPSSSSELDLLASQTKPPIGPLSKRKKVVDCNLDIRATPSSSAAALLALNPLVQAEVVLPPGTPGNSNVLPSTMVHLPLRVETPFTIRSASPNSLSIAKALSLLGGSVTLAQAQNLVNLAQNLDPVKFEIKEVKTPHNTCLHGSHSDSQGSQHSKRSTPSSTTSSEGVDNSINSSMELTDGESDITEHHKMLEYEDKIQMQLAAAAMFPIQ